MKKVFNWTPARRHSFIVAVLRAGTRRWPPRFIALEEAKTEKKTNVLTGRMAQHYKCKKCKKDFPLTGVQVDHKVPVVGRDGFTTWDDFINNLFCSIDNLQVLCKACHSVKTKKESNVRSKKV